MRWQRRVVEGKVEGGEELEEGVEGWSGGAGLAGMGAASARGIPIIRDLTDEQYWI